MIITIGIISIINFTFSELYPVDLTWGFFSRLEGSYISSRVARADEKFEKFIGKDINMSIGFHQKSSALYLGSEFSDRDIFPEGLTARKNNFGPTNLIFGFALLSYSHKSKYGLFLEWGLDLEKDWEKLDKYTQNRTDTFSSINIYFPFNVKIGENFFTMGNLGFAILPGRKVASTTLYKASDITGLYETEIKLNLDLSPGDWFISSLGGGSIIKGGSLSFIPYLYLAYSTQLGQDEMQITLEAKEKGITGEEQASVPVGAIFIGKASSLSFVPGLLVNHKRFYIGITLSFNYEYFPVGILSAGKSSIINRVPQKGIPVGLKFGYGI
jgi:hypothetical protein